MGSAERGIPPPSSEILIVMSSEPSTTMTLTGGNESSLSTPYRSTTALSEFFSSSKQMCDRCPGMYGNVRSLGHRSWMGGPLNRPKCSSQT